MANVWGYWKCHSCGKVLRADKKYCTSCGNPVEKDIKFFLLDPNNVEYVDESQENDIENWICDYCNIQNSSKDVYCGSCGAPRSDESKTYSDIVEDTVEYPASAESIGNTASTASIWTAIKKKSNNNYLFKAITAIVIGALLLFGIWFFTPVEHNSYVDGFYWERSIAVETYTLCHESGWSVPSGGIVTSTKQEVHHYDTVVDHYETKSKKVPKQVQDGYDITYQDLGNGQFKEVKEPKYKTVYETSYYEEAVYRSIPVEKTKYYYDIGRWKKTDSIDTSGIDKTVYFGECTLEKNISNPNYGDQRQAERTEHYYVLYKDHNDKESKKEYDYGEWEKLKVEDKITYKAFRCA